MNCRRLFKLLLIMSLVIALSSCTSTTLQTRRPVTTPTASVAERNYTQLQRVLPLYQEAVQHPWPTIPARPKLQPGTQNIHVLALRGRLKATGELKPEDDTGMALYDEALTQAVKQFQLSHGLEPTGAVGPATLVELNISPEERLRQLEINIQRWEKLSHELSNRYIMVNVPDYRLQVVENGTTVLSMKAIVGKPDRQTPELSSTITRVVFNPYWNVPRTIANKDIIPKVLNNPNYLAEMRIAILDQQSDDPVMINPDEVDWQAAEENGFPYHFRQEPGEQNALGLVKFEFQNDKDIYLHDTPAKNLFAQHQRDYSSGCIRLEKPFELANYLMKSDPNWDDDQMQEILDSGKTNYIRAAMPTDIFITYLTAWVDDHGTVQFRHDIYAEDNIDLAAS